MTYIPKSREYGLLVDGGPVVQTITICPWCGSELPPSLRVPFVETLEALGIDPYEGDVPIDFRSDAWWRLGRRSE